MLAIHSTLALNILGLQPIHRNKVDWLLVKATQEGLLLVTSDLQTRFPRVRNMKLKATLGVQEDGTLHVCPQSDSWSI